MLVQLRIALLTGICFFVGSVAISQSACQADDGCGGWFLETDLLFMELNRADGFSQDVFGYETAPRFRIGYETSEGAGVRFQYWSWEHSAASGQNGAPSGADTYNLDLGAYRTLTLARGLDLELSGGVRYSDYSDFNIADAGQVTGFTGFGGYLGVKVTQDMLFDTQGYVRGKWVLLADDSNDNGAVGFDANRGQQELAIGIEKELSIASMTTTGRFGYEWQEWDGYQDDSDGGLSFAGFILGLDFLY